ncbi:MAG: hypothetical protein V4447_05405 [Pseudomonadota bacterium]
MSTTIYDKTDKGREELSTRKYQLAPRSRSLLVLVDGKQTVADLLKKIAGLGLNQQSIQDLLDQEFITVSQNVAQSAVPAPSAVPAQEAEVEVVTEALPISVALSKPILVISENPEENARRFQALSKFFNETIKSTLGFRGFTLQLKVERAANIQEFEDLRIVYIEAVLKAKGKDLARSLRDRLDQLLYAELETSFE